MLQRSCWQTNQSTEEYNLHDGGKMIQMLMIDNKSDRTKNEKKLK